MHLLVDGHNLIAQMPGISLADADDEARLVLLLRGFAARKRGRLVLVVFDRGVYGHPQQLDGYSVTCHFAKSPQDADTQLIRRLRTLKRPGEWMLVSSDRAVARVAEERGVRVIGARDFAAQLLAPTAPRANQPEEKPERRLSEAEIAEWLAIFGQAPEDDGTTPSLPPQLPPAPKKRKRRRG
jgi:predicted RNA-binding protein with PIN domain